MITKGIADVHIKKMVWVCRVGKSVYCNIVHKTPKSILCSLLTLSCQNFKCPVIFVRLGIFIFVVDTLGGIPQHHILY